MSHEDFRRRVRQSFDEAGARLVLAAHDCACERLGDAADDHLHPAEILLHQRADPVVVTAALLTPLRRLGCLGADEARTLFGDEPARLSEKVLPRPDERPSLDAISDDLRAVVLSLGLRLAELERLAALNGANYQDIELHANKKLAQETLRLYVPLADRLGMGDMRIRLEDAGFHVLDPETYRELAQRLSPVQAADNVCLELLKGGVQRLLAEHGIQAQVAGRTKGLYSVYRKMTRLQCPPEEVLDRVGLRIIVPSVEECYATLGLLHTHFRPIPGTFDDYIALPKGNGYRSLHTCVYPVPDISHKPVEFQIRTAEMHREAEFGVAAHWRYKSAEEAQAVGDRQLRWLRRLLARRKQAATPDEFIAHLHRQIFDDRLVVFDEGADGRPVRLPAGATVQDFLDHLAPNGQEVSVLVNGTPRPADYPLQDGDYLRLEYAR